MVDLVILNNSAPLVELVVLERCEQVAVGVQIRGLGVGEGDGGLEKDCILSSLCRNLSDSTDKALIFMAVQGDHPGCAKPSVDN